MWRLQKHTEDKIPVNNLSHLQKWQFVPFFNDKSHWDYQNKHAHDWVGRAASDEAHCNL